MSSIRRFKTTRIAALCTMALAAAASHAALTEISQVPLLVSFGIPVKPNLLFILDDSGSMDLSFLPEAANRGYTTYSNRSPQCNGLVYNKTATYEPPKDYAGVSKGNAALAQAFNITDDLGTTRSVSEKNTDLVDNADVTITITNNGAQNNWYPVGDPVILYDGTNHANWMMGKVKSWSTVTKKLVITMYAKSGAGNTGNTPRVTTGYPQFVVHEYTGALAPLGWTYNADGSIDTSTTFYKQCASVVGAAPGSGVFTTRIVRPGDGDVQNFANWWAYYGTRMRMMQTVTANAFQGIDDTFRVGFSRISSTSAKEVAGSGAWLHTRDFAGGVGGQKSKFYTALFGTSPSSYTPLRGALSIAGQYFAKKANAQDYDPVQHSCQKHFALLATDGAWNTDLETATFGPFDLKGIAVGQQDGDLKEPYLDKLANGNAGPSNTLADVASYYYRTDLRTDALQNCTGSLGNDVCENGVQPVGKDTATHQHMTTFTMSLGQSGSLRFVTGYEAECSKASPATDYCGLLNGTKRWPSPSNDAAKVDDLWHAAVNGHGTFFNASSAQGVADGLRAALAEIGKVTGRGAAGATSTIQPVQGDNAFYVGSFTSGTWNGDLVAYQLNLETFQPILKDQGDGTFGGEWSAAKKLPAAADRKILYGSAMKAFTFGNLDGDGLGGNFKDKCKSLSHYGGLSSDEQNACVAGSAMVNYLRGLDASYFRTRGDGKILGDIVGSAPVFDGNRGAAFHDAGYGDFVSSKRAGRKRMVYVGGNDGMMHAIDATTGVEQWAFVPNSVMSRLYKLADKNYAANHEFYVDGPALTGDVQVGGTWKTILVGGLGAGGRAYYALDVTDPTSPKFLWEFTNDNLGYTHAKPVITKRKKDGKWVVAVPSGYNNVGDGLGRMFLLDAGSGAVVESLSTGAGSVETPAGLGPLAGWVDDRGDNTTLRYYAGDNLGNVWRFDPDGLLDPLVKVVKLAELKVGGAGQPITIPPKLAEIKVAGYSAPTVFVGTGRMVGKTDLKNTATQSIYAIKDELGKTGWGDIRTTDKLVPQVISTETVVDANGVSSPQKKVGTATAINWSDKAGWYLDLSDTGERINVPMVLSGSKLVAASNVPKQVASCEKDNQGYAWIYYLDIATGAAEVSANMTSMMAGINALGTGVLLIPASNEPPTFEKTKQPVGTATESRRANWREILDR